MWIADVFAAPGEREPVDTWGWNRWMNRDGRWTVFGSASVVHNRPRLSTRSSPGCGPSCPQTRTVAESARSSDRGSYSTLSRYRDHSPAAPSEPLNGRPHDSGSCREKAGDAETYRCGTGKRRPGEKVVTLADAMPVGRARAERGRGNGFPRRARRRARTAGGPAALRVRVKRRPTDYCRLLRGARSAISRAGIGLPWRELRSARRRVIAGRAV